MGSSGSAWERDWVVGSQILTHTTFCHGIIHYNTGEEERDPTLELAMEYTGALSTIVFNKSCHLRDLTEA